MLKKWLRVGIRRKNIMLTPITNFMSFFAHSSLVTFGLPAAISCYFLLRATGSFLCHCANPGAQGFGPFDLVGRSISQIQTLVQMLV